MGRIIVLREEELRRQCADDRKRKRERKGKGKEKTYHSPTSSLSLVALDTLAYGTLSLLPISLAHKSHQIMTGHESKDLTFPATNRITFTNDNHRSE